MEKSAFLGLIEDLVEMDKGSLKGDESLSALAGWDSLAVVGFIALVDREFGMEVPAREVSAASTIGDLVALLGGRVSG